MIHWNRYSFNRIFEKWNTFLEIRNKYPGGIPKKYEKCHITCLEREALIKHLLQKIKENEINILND